MCLNPKCLCVISGTLFLLFFVLILQTTDRKIACKSIAKWAVDDRPNRQRSVIMTRGKDPVLAVSEGNLQEYPCIPVHEEEIVDVNGCGDATLGGFLAAFIQGKSFDKCMEWGLYAANVVIQHRGCSFTSKPPSLPLALI